MSATGKRTMFGASGILLLVLLIAAGWWWSVARERHVEVAEGPTHVLLITIDTIRADHCSVYGYRRKTTPVLERLARQGLLVEQAYSPMPTTLPAHASMLTGLYPAAHGVTKNGWVLGESADTLTERLRQAGYRTAAVVSSFAVAGKFGLAQGFDSYDDDFGGGGGEFGRERWEGHEVTGEFDRDAAVTSDEAIAWLREAAADPEAGTRPFFLWVHYFDPHAPYAPPAPYRVFEPPGDDELDAVIAAYDGEILETDTEIGRLLEVLDELELAGSTLVVVTGDHGEGLMQHGWMEHGLQVYEEAVRVPWIVRWPGRVPAGRRLGGPIELTDMMPTLLGMLGLEEPGPAVQGRNLAVPMRGGEPGLDPAHPVFLQRRLYETPEVGGRPVVGDRTAVRRARWKYIEARAESSFELYRLDRDGRERNNLIDEEPDEARRLAAILENWRRATAAHQSVLQQVSDEDVEKLRSLGYVQ